MNTQTSTERYSRPSSLLREDVIPVPSSSRSGLVHMVAVNVLAGGTTGCTCEAGQREQYCQHRKAIDSQEATYGFARCKTCDSLMRLEEWPALSGPVLVWSCPQETPEQEHNGREAGTRILFRTAAS